MNRTELVKLIDSLTKASNFEKSLTVPDDEVKKLKQFAKESNAHVKDVFDLLWARLSAKNPLVRIGVMVLLDVLFMRSAYLRQLTVGSMAELLTLSVGSNRGRPLPPPTQHAGRLRQFALTALERWAEQFGNCYPQLATARSFVRDTLRFELPSVAQQREADAARRRAEGTQRLLQAKYEQLTASADAKLMELEQLLTEIDTCFAMLVPDVEEDDLRSILASGGRSLTDAFQETSRSTVDFDKNIDDNDDRTDDDHDRDSGDRINRFDLVVNGSSVVRRRLSTTMTSSSLSSLSSSTKTTTASTSASTTSASTSNRSSKSLSNKRKFVASSTVVATKPALEKSLPLNETAPSLMAFVPIERSTSDTTKRAAVTQSNDTNDDKNNNDLDTYADVFAPQLTSTQFSDSLNALSAAKLQQTLQLQRSSSEPIRLPSNVQHGTRTDNNHDDDDDDDEVDEEGRSLNATINVVASEVNVSIANTKPLVKESRDNAVLFASIRERMTPLVKFLSGLGVAWETVLTKIVADEQKVPQAQRDALLHRIVNCKNSIRRVVAQCNDLGIAIGASNNSNNNDTIEIGDNNNNNNNVNDDVNVEWEEGARKDGYEAVVAQPQSAPLLARPLHDAAPLRDAEPPLVVASYTLADDAPCRSSSSSTANSTTNVDAASSITASTTSTSTSAVATSDEPPKYVPYWAQKNPQPGAVFRNVSREQLRRLAPVVEPQPCVLNWSSDINVPGVNRQHRFFGEADAPSLVVTSSVDPAAHLYVTYMDGSDGFDPKRRKVD